MARSASSGLQPQSIGAEVLQVRQFDLRLPSSAYPSPRGGRGFLAHRADHDNSNVPPPLISYKRFNLDLNTISCSASQPHYIALGGAHLHCFLHDRRMLGRDIGGERGEPMRSSPSGSMSQAEEEVMGQATRCVRKFAPEGRKKMRRTDNGHITACKISDANPNQMIASWSGDHIYSFDLVRSPDASDHNGSSPRNTVSRKGKSKLQNSHEQSRKRESSKPNKSVMRGQSSRLRLSRSAEETAGDRTLHLRYTNGRTEEMGLDTIMPNSETTEVQEAYDYVLTESQKRSMRIARSTVNIRRLMFSLHASRHSANGSLDPASHEASFTAALDHSASCLPGLDDISRLWRYPMDPLPTDIMLQQTLRENRQSTRRFVQAAGTLARLLGGRFSNDRGSEGSVLGMFKDIDPAPNETVDVSPKELFCYDFLKSIILWLEGGTQAILQGFKRTSAQRRDHPRFPIPEDAQLDALHDILIPYLLRLANTADRSIPNVDASRFERDETRQSFRSQESAVLAFAQAIRIPLEDLSQAVTRSSAQADSPSIPLAQDRNAALRYWGFKVGRGLLLNAAEGVNYQIVDMAFGGLGNNTAEEDRMQEDIDPEEEDDVVESATITNRSVTTSSNPASHEGQSEASEVQQGQDADDAMQLPSTSTSTIGHGSDTAMEEAGSDAEVVLIDDLHDEIAERMVEEDENNADGVYTEDDDDDNEDNEADDDDEDGDITAEERSFMFRSASARGKIRESVESDVPCYAHTHQYRGHCNVKTVKDANFFGLQDEYVVSGSDSGHVFVWDKKTSELVNILEGDSEVVNVIQGERPHPSRFVGLEKIYS